MNEENVRRLYQIGRFLNDIPSFCEIGTDYRHWIKQDITTRFGQSLTTEQSLDEFIRNYIKWVNKHIGGHCPDTPEMWIQWAEMLKELHWGTN